MTHARPPKKSETLEVRLPLDAKSAFMAHCRRQGTTASEAVRRLIETDMIARSPVRAVRSWLTAAAAVAGLLIGALAAPSIALALPTERAAFDRLDLNRDGLVSFAEFQRR